MAASPINNRSKFKQPMTFTQATTPSPSRAEVWKRELGFEDDENQAGYADCLTDDDDEDHACAEADQTIETDGKPALEVQVLKLELSKKEAQKEDLLLKLKDETDRANIFKGKLAKAEQTAKSQMKIMKKTYETHLQELRTMIGTLRDFASEQENRLGRSLDPSITLKNGSIAEPALSVRGFISAIERLQTDKTRLTEALLKKESALSEKDAAVEKLRNAMAQDYVTKSQYEKLSTEFMAVRKSCSCAKDDSDQESKVEVDGDSGKRSNQSCLEERLAESAAVVAKMKKEMEALEKELIQTREEHTNTVLRFEDEIFSLKRTQEEAENKYIELVSESAKDQLKSTDSQETLDELAKVKSEKNKLVLDLMKIKDDHEEQARSNASKIDELNTCISSMELKLKDREDELCKSCEKQSMLEKQLIQMNSKNKEQKIKIEQLQKELASKESDLVAAVEEFQYREEQHRKALIEETSRVADEIEGKYSALRAALAAFRNTTSYLAQKVLHLSVEQKNLRKDVQRFCDSIQPALSEAGKKLLAAIDDTNTRMQLLVHRYKQEIVLRKKLHNELVELKGNIRVFCRVRPRVKEDGDGRPADDAVTFDADDDGVIGVVSKGTLKTFEMDRVFQPKSSQAEIFREVQSLITSCLDGFNVCIFAYGQTGSGKTYTMEGPSDDPGINQRALQLLFKDALERADWRITISVSCLEIYNEMLRDLLSDDPTLKLEIKHGKEGMHVPGLKVVQVSSVDQVNEVFALGRSNRMTAATDMNEHSSRSHSVLMVNVYGVNSCTGTRITGKMNLVDLAGSERVSKSGAEGLRMKEAQNINKSLSALGDVIHSLKNGSQHVPYRNTKLTYLLQDSLGGDSKTLMVVHVSPVEKNACETVCSLTFAQRVRAVELGMATRKVEKS